MEGTAYFNEPPNEQKNTPEQQKMTFREFIAFSEQEPEGWVNEYLNELIKEDIHWGDCTRVASTCSLCQLHNLLSDYFDYRFDRGVHTAPTPTDAVEFAKWIGEKYFMTDDAVFKWRKPGTTLKLTSSELYQIFKSKNE